MVLHILSPFLCNNGYFNGWRLSVQYIFMSTDWQEVSIWIALQFRMRSLALSVWFNDCCPCQSLTGVGVTYGVTKRRYAVCLTACFMGRFIHWILELTGLLYFYIWSNSYIKYVLNLYKTAIMTMKCKHHESHITFGIQPNRQTQKWEHLSVQAHW